MGRLRSLISGAALALTFALGACATAPASDPTLVAIDSGRIQGAQADGVIAFLGVPFAAPPVGDLRWRAPQPPSRWDGVRQATAYANDCMQQPFPGDAAPLGTPPAEDCLYANVWRPAGEATNLPVMVWIYGGGYVNGGSSPPTYTGARLADDGIVVVSFNYRLGRFGFFAHPALSAENADGGLLGNYGYMDQIAALKWVQRNIAAFGGDPDRVTLVGESAGGGSVHAMLTSPLSQGLVHQAVIMSGGGRGSLMGDNTVANAEATGLRFAESKGVTGDGADALAKLRALSAEDVTDGLSMRALFTPGPRTFSSPMTDGKLIVEDAQSAYEAGRFTRAPMLVGATSDDIGGGVSGADKDRLFDNFGANAARARAVFDPEGSTPLADLNRRVGLVTGSMIEPARFMAGLMEEKGVPAWHYRFSYVAESLRTPTTRGAGHATDIPYFFDTVDLRYGADTTEADRAMAKTMSAYLVSFVKTGDPNGAGLAAWPRYRKTEDRMLDFAMDGAAQPQVEPWKAELDLARDLLDARRAAQAGR